MNDEFEELGSKEGGFPFADAGEPWKIFKNRSDMMGCGLWTDTFGTTFQHKMEEEEPREG